METVEQYMSKDVITVPSSSTLVDAIQTMRQHHIGALLVKDGERVAGIFTERDLLNKIDIAQNTPLAQVSIKDLMTAEVATIDFDESYLTAITLMRRLKIRHIPIMKNNEVVGIVSLRDLVTQYEQHLQDLLMEKERFENIMHEIVDGIIICSADWTIARANLAARQYLDIAENRDINLLDYLYTHFSVSLPREKLSDTVQQRKSFLLTRGPSERSEQVRLNAKLNFFTDPQGKVATIEMTLRDITEAQAQNA